MSNQTTVKMSDEIDFYFREELERIGFTVDGNDENLFFALCLNYCIYAQIKDDHVSLSLKYKQPLAWFRLTKWEQLTPAVKSMLEMVINSI
jgi:hypothetical protein